ncbi:hypothetical protein AB0E88_28060 [Streptomyces sp. NPDC028635]|uniref:hypothetical protein n=1 Tax=Streptomyces sp. NPDC028635 TaxID=3154800 RepID=UPI0033CE19A2
MIQHASPTASLVGPADPALAVRLSDALTPPAAPAAPAAPKAPAPEIAVPHLMGLRTGADRPHRHKVPLRRLTAVTC